MTITLSPLQASSLHTAQVQSLLETRLDQMSPPRPVFESGSEPKAGRNYVTFQLTRRPGGNPRAGGPLSPSSWRLFIRSVGGDNNARVLLDQATAAVEDHTVTVSGTDSTPIRFEGEDGVREDENDSELYTGARTFTYSF